MRSGLGRRVATSIPVFGAIAVLGIFFYVPLVGLVARGALSDGRFQVRPILEIWENPYLRGVILFTIEQALLSTVLSVVVGFPMAYLLAVYEFPGRRILKSLTAVPFALPAITVALGFVIVFGNHGVLNRMLSGLFGVPGPPLRILYSLQGILLAHAFYNAPIIARFVSSAWSELPRNYEESARAMGARRGRIFFDITFPMLTPSLAAGAMLAFIYSFLSFPIVLILGGARFTTIEVEIYRRAIVETNYAGAAALATIELFLALLFTFAYLRIESRYGRKTRLGVARPGRPLFRGGDGRRRWLSGILYSLIIFYFVFYLGPVVGVLVNSLSTIDGGRTVFTLGWYREVFRPHYSSLIAASPLRSIENSIVFAFTSMGISLLIGTLIASALTFRRLRGKGVVETLVMAPLGISPVALGFAYLQLFSRSPFRLTGTAAAIIIVHSILAVPFVVRSLRPALERIEGRFREAARSLGASPLRSAVEVTLPLARNALTTAAVFAFAVSFAETSATIMLTRPQLLTMPVAVYYLLSGRQFGAASAMGMLLILVISISFLLIEKLGKGALGAGSGSN
jgi:thiamine transport system permease protein